jgi:alpha-L-rhamnosidase
LGPPGSQAICDRDKRASGSVDPFEVNSPDISAQRVFLAPPKFLADANAKLRHPAENGAWIWVADADGNRTALVRFRLEVHVDEAISEVVHITADQRFQFFINGRLLALGPDRCDLEHWTVHSLQLEIPAGVHALEVLVWHLAVPEDERELAVAPPMAQVTHRGGFMLWAQGDVGDLLNTGSAPWTVEDLSGGLRLESQRVPGYHAIGPAFHFDLREWSQENYRPAALVHPPLAPNLHGVRRQGWCLYPAELPEQRRDLWAGGRIRAVRSSIGDGQWSELPEAGSEAVDWNALLRGREIALPAHSTWEVIWDFETYLCGYHSMEVEGGEGARIEWAWAESLYEESSSAEVTERSFKGDRARIEGKVFVGLVDSWGLDGAANVLPAIWWRSGRYVRWRIEIRDEPLVLKRVGVLTTGYPLEAVSHFDCSDGCWQGLMELYERAFRRGSHETWTDTPYYEQLCYVGDNVICARANYAWFPDARLSRRSIRLFEWSRRASGFVAERYPSRLRQESFTFSLLWPGMLRDYAWWRRDEAFVREMLPALRSLQAEIEGVEADGMLREVPGWPFIDWCPEWPTGCGPGVREGDSSIVNLHWVLSLQAIAQVERAFGDPILAERSLRRAAVLFELICERYWDPSRQRMADTAGSPSASEMGQALVLLTGLADASTFAGCLGSLRQDADLTRATVYGSYYVLEALYLADDDEELHRRLRPWRELPEKGFTSTPEQNEPSRSDAHPWGAHPAWHAFASISGVRPDDAGFSGVTIRPCPGPLEWIRTKILHPDGFIELDLRFRDGVAIGEILLPGRLSGKFLWRGRTVGLSPGRNTLPVLTPDGSA